MLLIVNVCLHQLVVGAILHDCAPSSTSISASASTCTFAFAAATAFAVRVIGTGTAHHKHAVTLVQEAQIVRHQEPRA